MSQHSMTLIEYGSVELHPLIKQDTWLLSSKELSKALEVSLSEIVTLLPLLSEYKHYSYESIEYSENKFTSSILFFSKPGMIRIAYSLKSDKALEFLEFIENLHFTTQNSHATTHKFYKEIEDVLYERLKKIKTDPNTSLEEINKFILTLDNLVKKQDSTMSTQETNGNISDIIKTIINLTNSYTPKKN